MPACPKCGSPLATPLNCPACKSTFGRPLAFDETPAPAPSKVLSQELNLDRRTGPLPHSPPAPAPAAMPDRAWMAPPGESPKAPASPPSPARAVPPPLPRKSARVAPPAAAPAASQAAKPPAAMPPAAAPQPHAASILPEARFPPAPPFTPPGGTLAFPPSSQPIERPTAAAPAASNRTPAAPRPAAPSSPPGIALPMGVLPIAREAAPAPADPLSPALAPSGAAARSRAQDVEEVHAEPGSALAQLGAWLVDAIVLSALFALYLFAAQAIAGKIPPSNQTGLDWIIDRAVAWRVVLMLGAALLAVLSFVYSSLFHALGGRTLGKRIFGLTLVDSTGRPPALARSAVRSLLAFASAGLLLMGFVLLLFDRKGQSLHDKLTGTFVVRLAE